MTDSKLGPGIISGLEDLVGRTPMVRLRLPDVPDHVRLLAKVEMLNPLASVKDRAALWMLRDAERTGKLPLDGGGTVVEASSGNTAISLAALAAMRGHRCVIVLPDNATEERKAILRAYGAELVLADHTQGLPAAIAKAAGIAKSIPGSWLCGQEANPVNVEAHYHTTAPEIWEATGGEVDVVVCGVGTGGTLTGITKFMKERRRIHTVAVEPTGSPVLSGGERGPHKIPGMGGGFINPVTDVDCIDQVITVADEAAADSAKELTRSLGLFVGVSSGAAVHAARVLAASERWAGATIVTVLPDSGERYLSIWESLGSQAQQARAA
ncbi:PLP-dependent cysteine synthase family protein [Amycolatopsis sp. 195334CR]|uniref:PLP-dependent cysteine synthase family protein n=1 Tax=Amycolatopsis sp. 195334CR TaxID=2814588 RepID=UPI001A8C709B|nr:cysteine synthase family protein [Amycolatopsis sp. 195334CR]MBN6036981.1 cysteine synthase family protein [Amycolatopsis sp. 195334CR]